MRTRAVAKPPPRLTISQWARENLILSAEDSASPGKYQPSKAPYQAEIMDSVSDPLSEGTVIMSSAQVGKTLICKAIIGYYIDQDPAPILNVQPTLDMAEAFSKDRLAPMVRDTPCLFGKVADAKSRDSGNTILHKRFPGGHLTIVGANAPSGLASRPIRVALFDEVDRYPASSGTEGDPVSLGKARQKTFWNRRVIEVSTPGDEETSRIYPAWLASDMRRFHVPCPHCGLAQVLWWKNVKWRNDDPLTAAIVCGVDVTDEFGNVVETKGCGALWTDSQRIDSLQGGRWIAEHPERRVAGFHLNELYSPFRRLSEIVADFLTAKRSKEKLKAFVTTSLGEPWKDQEGDKVESAQLEARREPYIAPPPQVLLITMAVDTQDDRLEIEFAGWGIGDESWGIDHVVLRGDPGQPDIWQRLTDQLARTFRRSDGTVITPAGCFIDSAGHYTKQVYAWCQKHRGRVWPIIGRAGQGRPMIGMSQALIKDYNLRLGIVGVDTAKELLLKSRIQITAPGPGYCHWPASYPPDYFKQFTAEVRKVKYSHGHPEFVWVLPKGERNEALDLRVYGMALLALLRPNFEALAERLKPGAIIHQQRPRGARVLSHGVQG
jgi:phage terminase large subunit GpA-like protein